jgi:hypothetical protein
LVEEEKEEKMRKGKWRNNKRNLRSKKRRKTKRA